MKKLIAFLSILYVGVSGLTAQNREVITLDKNWLFIQSDPAGAEKAEYHDKKWEKVTVPHDWAIKGPFDERADAQEVMVTEDGERKARLRTGRTGSLPWVGTGWYRRKLDIPANTNNRFFLEFDGAMSNAVVYVNGEKVGEWPYGYSSFSFDITGAVKPGKENILAIRLENLPESSRWYPGAGLYRNVRLVKVNPVHIRHWGTYVTTPLITPEVAKVSVETTIVNHTGKKYSGTLLTSLYDRNGNFVGKQKVPFDIADEKVVCTEMDVYNPELWDTESPNLYKAVSIVSIDGITTDEYHTAFGIRSVRFDNEKGFFLNNKHTELKGVCQHHDLGPLGASVNYRALQRQLELLQEMGCNAIRCSHNPPTPELLDLCDEMGLLVIDEAFDEWKFAKCKNGYNRLWDDWAEKDMVAMIHRDRNHPCIIMWSIGNEIKEQDREDGWKYCRFLTDICHREDPTRPVTAGLNRWENAIKYGFAAELDVQGWNYKPQHYRFIHGKYPDWKMYGSETASTVSSRGEYLFPAEVKVHHLHDSNQCSSYDLEFPRWASLPDTEFAAQDDNDFMAGEFVWTGFDYLGEPTPYNWPSHSSYFGIFDLAGLPKDRYYLYKSKWSDKEVLHILPHWNWPERIGQETPIFVYTSFDTVELFVNGVSQGKKKKDTGSEGLDRYRLIWNDVLYTPGEIKAVAYDERGKAVREITKKTAGEPFAIRLEADRKVIRPDGKDLLFITVSVVDKDGNICPTAQDNISFKTKGTGFIRGVANGDPTNIQSLAGNEMKVFNGQCVVVVQSYEESGEIRLSANAKGINGSSLTIEAK